MLFIRAFFFFISWLVSSVWIFRLLFSFSNERDLYLNSISMAAFEMVSIHQAVMVVIVDELVIIC